MKNEALLDESRHSHTSLSLDIQALEEDDLLSAGDERCVATYTVPDPQSIFRRITRASDQKIADD